MTRHTIPDDPITAATHQRELSEELHVMRAELLAHCASVADQVEATAETWGGKEAAAEIARRIRSLMEGTR